MGIDAEMFVRTPRILTADEIRTLAWELGEAFGSDRFWIWRPSPGGIYPAGQAALHAIDVYEQDGPDLYPRTGEQFLRVHPATRYYGKNYERGDLPFLVTLAAWLEQRIPDGEVWYGGDSGGICAERFDATARTDLFAHFVRWGHRPYCGDPRARLDDPEVGEKKYSFQREDPLDRLHRPVCDFCVAPLRRYGFGGAGRYGAFVCPGCGYRTETHDGGETWAEPKKERV